MASLAWVGFVHWVAYQSPSPHCHCHSPRQTTIHVFFCRNPVHFLHLFLLHPSSHAPRLDHDLVYSAHPGTLRWLQPQYHHLKNIQKIFWIKWSHADNQLLTSHRVTKMIVILINLILKYTFKLVVQKWLSMNKFCQFHKYHCIPFVWICRINLPLQSNLRNVIKYHLLSTLTWISNIKLLLAIHTSNNVIFLRISCNFLLY